MINRLNLLQPPNGMATTTDEALKVAQIIGYPLIVRPSYVLGGRAMEIVYADDELRDYMQRSIKITKDSPILLDRFLDDAIEVDVDAVCDGEHVLIGGIMEHIEQAGVHSGDSACSLPPFSLKENIQNELRDNMRKMAKELGVVGLINAQFAIKDNKIYVLEVNPRAARTVPFISKVIGVSLAKVAACCMIGKSLTKQNMLNERVPDFFAVKKSVFPFEKFPGVDPILGPEMRSTGEVMGVGDNFAQAYAKSELATLSPQIPAQGNALISVRDADKPGIIEIAKKLQQFGYKIIATRGTAKALKDGGVDCEYINKVNEGRPHIVDSIKNDKLAFIINTTEGRHAIADSNAIRRSAVQHKVCYTTTLSGARAQVLALAYQQNLSIAPIQALHLRVKIL
jgi:carbamoyl-phosphate synthase large subunit